MFKLITKFIKSHPNLTAGIVLLLAGFIMWGISLANISNSQKTAAQPVVQAIKNNDPSSVSTKATTGIISGYPNRIQISDVGIDLKIFPGYYNTKTQTWTLTLNNAQYAAVTTPPNNREGLTFIYAHYRKGVFMSLPKIKPGDTAIITTSNGHVFTYKFIQSEVTTPTDTTLFNYRGKPVLILQTCTGAHFENRQLFRFDLVGVR